MRALALALGLTVSACAGDRPATDRPAPAPRPTWLVRGPGGLEPIEPGTRDPALLDADACRGCHVAQHAEWAASRHGQAWDNPIFRREYRQEPRRWCVRCHAPLTPQLEQVLAGGGPLVGQGVSCAGCHVRRGRLWARTRRAGSPHDTVASVDFGGPAFCADCHQFGFPRLDDGGEAVAMTHEPMQDTVGEFRAGRFAGVEGGCLACHGGSPGGHAFPGAHDPGMLASALGMAVCRQGGDLVIGLENRGAGHAVPTGDVHRHMVARAWRSSAPEALFEIFLGRRYDTRDDGTKRTVWDSRLEPGQVKRFRVAVEALAGEAHEPINVELVYVYTADEVPAVRRAPGEPTRRVVHELRRAWEELEACGPIATALTMSGA